MKFTRAIITSGPTKEWIDPVRFITNASSGKMGHAIASNLKSWIDEIIYIHGPVCSEFAAVTGAKNIYAETTADMKNAVLNELADNTLVIMAAAPADFKPETTAEQKIKKETISSRTIELVKNPDILINVSDYVEANRLKNVIRIGFAAETNDLEQHAMDKLQRKKLELVIANHVYKNDRGFGNIDSEINIYSVKGLQKAVSGNKDQIGLEVSDFLKLYLDNVLL